MIRIGTSGWSYRHWKGVFYPHDMPARLWLEFYARSFDCTELNASFYRLPSESMVEGWMRRTPDDFRFSVKTNRMVTHRRRLRNVEADIDAFMQRFAPLQPKIGPVLVQTPPSLAWDRDTVEAFLDLLTTRYPHYRYAVEPRHDSWFENESLDLLRRYRLALVIADSGRRFPSREVAVTDFVYIRFHGPSGLYTSCYTTEMLASWAERIREWEREGRDVWAFFNNDVGGHAVRNALELRHLLGIDAEGGSSDSGG